MIDHVDGVAFGVFVFLFLLVTVLGFAAARWRRAEALDSLDEWGLGGRGFGTFVAWFLIGGDIYTAYTFIAVPATLYAGSVVGFFAVPYTIVVYPLIFIFLPRLWSVSHRHGYVTPADFVQGRYDSRPLALAVALTGILATMPYIALQLVGMQVVLEVMGIGTAATAGSSRTSRCSSRSRCLAAYTYSSGPARARADRVRQGHADLHRDHRGGHLHPAASSAVGATSSTRPATASTVQHRQRRRDRRRAGQRRGHDPAGRGAVGLRVAGARLGAGAVHVPALGHRRARDPEPLGDPSQRGAAAGVLLPARPARAAGLRRDRRRRQGRPTRSSRCRSCSRSSSARGSPASRSRPSRSARWCRPRSCRSRRRTCGPATSTRRSSSRDATPTQEATAEQADVAGGEVRRAGVRARAVEGLRDQPPAARRRLDPADAAGDRGRALHALAAPVGAARRLGGRHGSTAPGSAYGVASPVQGALRRSAGRCSRSPTPRSTSR